MTEIIVNKAVPNQAVHSTLHDAALHFANILQGFFENHELQEIAMTAGKAFGVDITPELTVLSLLDKLIVGKAA